MVKEAEKVGLKVNTSKTKILTVNGKNTNITINQTLVEEVEKFTYLGSVVTPDGGAFKDVETRITKANYTFRTLINIWRSTTISTKTKLKIFNSNIKSVLLYGAETWLTNKQLIQKLQTFINKCLRRILRIYWPQIISNQELWEKIAQEPIEITVKRRTWRWIGHTLRKPDSDVTKQALEWNPVGTRKRGRPKDTWRRSLEGELKRMGKSWKEVKKEAKTRNRWRSIV